MRYCKMVCAGTLALSLLALSACGGQDAKTAVLAADYPKLTSAAELAEDAKQAVQAEYHSFSLACGAPDASAFADTYYHIDYDWNVWTEDECQKKLQAALALEQEDYQKKYLEINTNDLGGALGEVPEYHYESDTAIFSISPIADRTYYVRKPIVTLQTAAREEVGCYRINEGDSIDGVSYPLSGQSYSLADAAAYCDQYLEALKDILEFESASLRKLFVYQLTEDEDTSKTGDYVYYLYYAKTADGVTLESDCTTYWNLELPTFDEPCIVFLISAPNQIAQWYDQSTKHLTEKQELDGVLPLSYALDKVEAEVAEYSNYQVASIELNYAALQWSWDSSTFYYEPYWCIRLASGKPKGGASNLDWDPCAMAYVNAATGGCYIISNIAGSLLGTDQYFENPDWDQETNPDAKWRVKEGSGT